MYLSRRIDLKRFLSTPSGWRATAWPTPGTRPQPNFYPRPPGGGRPREQSPTAWPSYFYPRPPGGGRPCHAQDLLGPVQFLSTPSGWRATQGAVCGLLGSVFLSTPSGWRATCCSVLSRRKPCSISIHALRVEGDRRFRSSMYESPNFYPRPPGGGRPDTAFKPAGHILFLSTPSGWRATARYSGGRHVQGYFYPRPPGGGRPLFVYSCSTMLSFLSTPSGWRATFICTRKPTSIV